MDVNVYIKMASQAYMHFDMLIWVTIQFEAQEE